MTNPDLALHISRQSAEDYDDPAFEAWAYGDCKACGDTTDTPPVCENCSADREASRAHRQGREWT